MNGKVLYQLSDEKKTLKRVNKVHCFIFQITPFVSKTLVHLDTSR